MHFTMSTPTNQSRGPKHTIRSAHDTISKESNDVGISDIADPQGASEATRQAPVAPAASDY
jgi:hypothetical protein